MDIRGRCHCGNIAFRLCWRPEPDAIPARACGCTFCTKHGGVWTSCATGTLEVGVADLALVSSYGFGTGTADFRVCARCGVVPLVTSTIDGTEYAVVNVNAFEGVDPALLRPLPASFDGESEGDRLARRQRNWIRNVRHVPRGSL